MSEQWVTYWSKAQRGMGLVSPLFQPHTRVSMKVPRETSFTFRFATFYEAYPVTISNIQCRSDKEVVDVYLNGCKTYEMLPQTSINSDAVTFAYPVEKICLTYDITASHIPSSAVQIHPYDEIEVEHDLLYLLCGVDVYTKQYTGCISMFGDSISEQGMWMGKVKNWLKDRGYVLLNHGISGNRLLREMERVEIDEKHVCMFENTTMQNSETLLGQHLTVAQENLCFGKAGVHRFQEDVLPCRGLTFVIFALGVNDVYQPGTFCATMEELPTLKQFQEGYQGIQQWGVPLLNLAITPFKGSVSYTEDKENLRLQMNYFLSVVEDCLGYVPLCEGLCEQESKWMDGYHQGDYLHPNIQGGEVIANQVIQELSTLWKHGYY